MCAILARTRWLRPRSTRRLFTRSPKFIATGGTHNHLLWSNKESRSVVLCTEGPTDRVEHMSSRQTLPEGLAHMPAGPELAAALASVDRTRLYGTDLYTLLRVRARQVAHEQAQLLADALETARCPGEGETLARVDELDEFSADQIAFELTWSRSAAAGHVALGQDLIDRLPVVYASLLAGRIDMVKARAFSDALLFLPGRSRNG
jgi:hypothetical protein